MIVQMKELLLSGFDDEVEADRQAQGVDTPPRVPTETTMDAQGKCLRDRIRVIRCYV